VKDCFGREMKTGKLSDLENQEAIARASHVKMQLTMQKSYDANASNTAESSNPRCIKINDGSKAKLPSWVSTIPCAHTKESTKPRLQQ